MYMIRRVIAGIVLKNITTTLFSTHFVDSINVDTPDKKAGG
jgi:hypothetical protein